METTHKPRFRRSPEIAPIQLTQRDLEVLHHVQRHRFLRSSHIVELAGGSAQQILRRLQLLYHHAYLERPRAQLIYFHEGPSQPIVYGLGSKGAALLRSQASLPFHDLDWSEKNSAVHQPFLQHALFLADFMVGMEISCRDNLWLTLLHADDLMLPGKPRRVGQSFQWNVALNRSKKIGVVPDAVFGLGWRHPGDKHKDTIYFVEADRGTMPIMRGSPAQSFFFGKLLAYQQSWEQGLLAKHFGNSRFRVLTVTSTPERRDRLIEACQKLASGKGLFLFTDHQTVGATARTLLLPWRNSCGGVEFLA